MLRRRDAERAREKRETSGESPAAQAREWSAAGDALAALADARPLPVLAGAAVYAAAFATRSVRLNLLLPRTSACRSSAARRSRRRDVPPAGDPLPGGEVASWAPTGGPRVGLGAGRERSSPS